MNPRGCDSAEIADCHSTPITVGRSVMVTSGSRDQHAIGSSSFVGGANR